MTASPTKLKNIKQEVITIEKPFGGWASQKSVSGQPSSVPVEGGKAQYSLSAFINLYRNNFAGHIAPGECFNFQLTDVGGIVNQLPVATAILSQNYAVLANNRVVQYTNQAIGQANFWDTAGHGGHSAQSSNSQNNDIAANIDLSVTPNLAYIFYSWEDATDGDIGVITQAVSGGAFTQTFNWFSSLAGGAALTAGVPRKLGFGTDGNLYCLNGQYIAQAIIVGNHFASAAGNVQRLNLGNGYVANSWTPYQNFMVIIGNKSADVYGSAQYTRVRVWFWDYAGANPTFTFDLNDYNGLAVYVDPYGNLWAVTSGKDGMTSLNFYDGTKFAPPPGAQQPTASISSPLHNQIDSFNGLIHFTGNNSVNQWDGKGFHNSTGQVVPNNAPNPPTKFGFLKNIDTLYAGIKLTNNQTSYPTSYGIWSLVDIAGDTTYAPGAVFDDQLRVLGYHGRVVAIRLYFSQFGTGASFKVSLFQGYDTVTDLVNRTITYSVGKNYNVVTIPANFILDSFWTQFTFTHTSATAIAAILRKAEIVVEPTDFKL